jgi:hypothetical protein
MCIGLAQNRAEKLSIYNWSMALKFPNVILVYIAATRTWLWQHTEVNIIYNNTLYPWEMSSCQLMHSNCFCLAWSTQSTALPICLPCIILSYVGHTVARYTYGGIAFEVSLWCHACCMARLGCVIDWLFNTCTCRSTFCLDMGMYTDVWEYRGIYLGIGR